MFSSKRIVGVALLSIAVAIPWLAVAPIGQAVKVAGTFQMAYSDRQTAEVPDVPAHMLALTVARGSNHSTGASDFMSGARVTIAELVDLVQGNGTNEGYVLQSKGADSVFARINGRVTTTLSPQGSPSTTVRGDWTFTKGTGQYEGIQGRGTFEAAFTSENEFTVHWQGERSK